MRRSPAQLYRVEVHDGRRNVASGEMTLDNPKDPFEVQHAASVISRSRNRDLESGWRIRVSETTGWQHRIFEMRKV